MSRTRGHQPSRRGYQERREHTRARMKHRRGSGAGFFLSIALHLNVLVVFARVVGLEPSGLTLEVFAAEPVADRPAPAPAAPAPGSQKPAGPRQARVSRPRPLVVASSKAAPAAATIARVPVPVTPTPEPVAPVDIPATVDTPEAVDVAGLDGLTIASAPVASTPPMTLTPAKTLTPIEPPAALVPSLTPSIISAAQPSPELALLESPVVPQATAPPARAITPAESVPPDALTTESSEAEAARERGAAVPPAPNPHVAASRPASTPVMPPAPTPAARVELPASGSQPRSDLARAEQPAGSAVGLGLGRLRIRVDGARVRTTTRDVEVVSGTFVGGAASRVVVRIGDAVAEPRVDGRAFSAAVPLQPGLNHVRITARDPQGGEVEETLTVQYNTPVSLTITSPRDGYTLTAEDPPLVVVQGQVDDRAVSSVWLVTGDRRVAVPVVGGRFRHTVPVLAPTVPVRVETPAPEGQAPASATITVHAAAAPIVALLLRWPGDTAGPADVAVAWRPRADRLDGSVPRVALDTAGEDASPDLFYLRNPKPGVYTFVLTYRPGAARTVQPALYVPNGGGGLRLLKPVTLDASGRTVLARVLMPHGILWEQDDWFTGRSASGDAITKFRFPDGITWTERIGTIQ